MIGAIKNIVAQATLNKLTNEVVSEEFYSLHNWQLLKRGYDPKKINSKVDKYFEYQEDSLKNYYQENKERFDNEIKLILEIAISYIN